MSFFYHYAWGRALQSRSLWLALKWLVSKNQSPYCKRVIRYWGIIPPPGRRFGRKALVTPSRKPPALAFYHACRDNNTLGLSVFFVGAAAPTKKNPALVIFQGSIQLFCARDYFTLGEMSLQRDHPLLISTPRFIGTLGFFHPSPLVKPPSPAYFRPTVTYWPQWRLNQACKISA